MARDVLGADLDVLGGGSGSGQNYPWQFHVANYGAVGDGKVITDAAIATTSRILTSATAGFSQADVGKHIMINNAGTARDANHSGCLFSTIASVQSASQVTLVDPAVVTVSGMSAVYGTDDTAAIQAAMAALGAYSGFKGSPFYAELLADPAIYCLATPPTPGGDPAHLTYGNAQIPLPVVDLTGGKAKPTVVIKGGTSDNSTLDSWHQADPQTNGTTFMSMIEVNAYDATYGPPSVIGGPTTNTAFGGGNFFNNMLVVIDAIQIVCPVNPGQIALDFFKMGQFAIKTASLDVFAGVISTPPIDLGSGPINTRGQGLRVSDAGLNDRCDIDSLSIEGYYYGMSLDEHVAAQRIAIIYTNTAIYIPPHGGNQASHGAWIGYASLEICNYCVYTPGAAGSNFGLVISNLDNEGGVVEHIHDPANYLTGQINICPSNSDVAPQFPIVNGAGNLEIKNLSGTRGAVTAPSLPATTVAFQNPFWRDAAVTITGGTVSVVSVDGQSLGVTSGTVFVPSGKNIAITYTVAPTWKWTLL